MWCTGRSIVLKPGTALATAVTHDAVSALERAFQRSLLCARQSRRNRGRGRLSASAGVRFQPHPIAITLNADAKAVMLDFVEPLWAGRDLGCVGRQAELKRLKHAGKIGIGSRFCESAIGRPLAGLVRFRCFQPGEKPLPVERGAGRTEFNVGTRRRCPARVTTSLA